MHGPLNVKITKLTVMCDDDDDENDDDDDDDDDDDNDDVDKNREVFSQLTWSGVKQFVKHWNKNNLEVQPLFLCVPHTFIHAYSSVYF